MVVNLGKGVLSLLLALAAAMSHSMVVQSLSPHELVYDTDFIFEPASGWAHVIAARRKNPVEEKSTAEPTPFQLPKLLAEMPLDGLPFAVIIIGATAGAAAICARYRISD
ncbi:MAG: hypothetical protein JST40_06775 [Armatimonadetes bacterium]|nr:hypothetical protein [Armatimonadota bacterium]